jgi:DNA-binding transcriptional regulator LsrR (DeoR family)
MPSLPDLRIITKAARLYYEEHLTQTEIAGRLGISQVAVSRLLKKAEEHGIVRTTVISPPGAFTELEALLEQRFGLSQVVIAEAARDTEEAVLNAIGSAAAQLLETMLKSGEVIGISSWSASLLSMVNQMHPVRLRFYDANGREIKGPLGNRVIGIDLERLRRIRTAVGIAGGKRKFAAILGGLRGKWINTLVTDQYTADRLAKQSAREQLFPHLLK